MSKLPVTALEETPAFEDKDQGEVIWDPTDPITRIDPYPMYNILREKCPVAHTDRLAGSIWGLFRYNDIMEVVKDTTTYSNAQPRHEEFTRIPFETDPPEHTTYRRILQPYFSQAYMDQLEPSVRRLAVELLEPLLTRGRVDLAKEFTYSLPVRVICSFLNLPDKDWYDIHVWSEEIYQGSFKDQARVDASVTALINYVKNLIADRRATPRDPAQDLTSALLAGQHKGEPLSEGQIIGALHLLITAGHDSTTSSLGIAINYLANHPQDQAILRENPSLIPVAVEEILRYETPVQYLSRTVTREAEIDGVQFKKGDRLWLCWGSGNRDEEAFPHSDQCLISRNPNRHLVFGHGIHKCIGAPVARLELKVALEELLARTKSFEPDGPAIRSGFPRFGASSLPLILKAK